MHKEFLMGNAAIARGAAAAAANGKQPSPQEMMAWMTPFSEN